MEEQKPVLGGGGEGGQAPPKSVWAWVRWLLRQPLMIVILVLLAIGLAFYIVDLLQLLPRR